MIDPKRLASLWDDIGADHVEDVSLRTAESKTFNLPNGRRKVVMTVGRVHWDDNGTWREVDTTPVDLGTEWLFDQVPYTLRVRKDRPEFTYTDPAGETATVSLFRVGNGSLNLNNIQALVVDRGIQWNLVNGSSFILQIREDKVEFWKVLNNPARDKHFEWTVERSPGFTRHMNTQSVGRDAKGQPLEMLMDVPDETVLPNGNSHRNLGETWSGRVAVIVDQKTRRREWQDAGSDSFPLEIDAPDVYTIAATANDVQQWWGASNWTGPASYDSLTLGSDYYYLNYWYFLGFRFPSITLASGDTVSLAEFKCVVDSVTNGGPNGSTVYLADEDTVAAWVYYDGPGDVFDDGTVTSGVDATTEFQSTGARTFDVTTQVTAVKNRGGWTTGNAMAVIVGNDHDGQSLYATVEDYQKAGGTPASLEITIGGGTHPVGPFVHPFYGPFRGPIT